MRSISSCMWTRIRHTYLSCDARTIARVISYHVYIDMLKTDDSVAWERVFKTVREGS